MDKEDAIVEDEQKEIDEWDEVLEVLETDPEGEKVTEDAEESLVPRYLRDPGLPTQKERDEHEILHIVYRPWCKWCVMGRGQSDHHKSSGQKLDDIQMPTISLDYMFFGNEEYWGKGKNMFSGIRQQDKIFGSIHGQAERPSGVGREGSQEIH